MHRRRPPSHPGGILRRLYLDPLDLAVIELARALGVSRKAVSKLVNERGRITPEMALRLSVALRTTPQLWLNLQQNYDLWNVRRSVRGLKNVRRLAA
jgi:addiction module HigA family antidote